MNNDIRGYLSKYESSQFSGRLHFMEQKCDYYPQNYHFQFFKDTKHALLFLDQTKHFSLSFLFDQKTHSFLCLIVKFQMYPTNFNEIIFYGNLTLKSKFCSDSRITQIIQKNIYYTSNIIRNSHRAMNEELNQFSKLNIPQLLCQNKCQAKMLCCNPQCDKMALVCRQSKCPCMPKEHRNCQFLYTQSLITQIVQKKGVLSPQISKAAQKIDQIYLQAIEKLSMDRQSLQIWKQNFGLTSNQAKLIQLMKTNKMDQIKGNLIYEIKQNVNKNNQYQWLTQQWVKDFWTKNQIDFNRIFAQLNKFHRQFNYQYATSKLQIPSFITKDVETIGSFFEKEICQYRLLYRASQQQFSALKFHQLCDGVKNTMTLALTQYGKIIGGFTPMPWRSTPGSEVQADVAGQSFLFSVSLAQKYSLTNPNIAIAHNRTRGPMFGEGRDLCISDQSNIKKDSFANFPYSYNNGAYKNNQIAHTALTGNQKGYYMHLKQWEVFQVIWKQ